MPRELAERIKREAKDADRSVSAQIRRLVQRAMDQRDEAPS